MITLKFIIFSDCHYGYKDGADVSIERVINLYESEYGKVDKIIILGDFIDLWRRSIDDVLIECKDVIDFLESRHQDVIYCKGNHDFIIDDLLKDRKINIVDRYKFGNYVFEHGHYIDYLSMSKLFVSIDDFNKFAEEMCYSDTNAGNFLSRMWNIYKLIYSGFGSSLFKYKNKVDYKFNKMDKLSNVIYGKYKKVIIGHFHNSWIGENLISLPAFSKGYFTIFNNGEFEYYYCMSSTYDIIKCDSI